MDLFISIDNLPRTTSKTKTRMKALGIESLWDLINHAPTRYVDYTKKLAIEDIRSRAPLIAKNEEKERVTVSGSVVKSRNQYTRSRFTIQKISIDDGTGVLTCTWFNQPYLVKSMPQGSEVFLSGVLKFERGEWTLFPEEYEIKKIDSRLTVHTGRIVPIYPETRGLSSRVIRDKIKMVLDSITKDSLEPFVPNSILKSYKLSSQFVSYQKLHFPESLKETQEARQRLAFDELFVLSLSSQLIRQKWHKEKASKTFSIAPHKKIIMEFIATLPFKLTHAQNRSIDEIIKDLQKTSPMNRLLQGDVGSGKTVVAAIACYLSYLNGSKSLMMAPTEILAKQHFETLSHLFADKLSIILVTGSRKTGKKELEEADIVVGTHALISQTISFNMVGLVVIDEQHKFGVSQRAILHEKGINPHLLTMTATPIPRTVSLTLYGELDVSIIDEMPKGRMITKTYYTPTTKREDAYKWIAQKISDENEQVFIVCPLIEESEHETIKSVKAVTVEFEHLKKHVFQKFRIGLLHGRMKSKDKDETMNKFSNGDYQILVSTPVVEVGVDIPNANIIIIEAAERFGLAQLHQLRGRVGRSERQAYCLLFTEKEDPTIISRLKTFSKITSGFELAEYDLSQRGAGEIYGIRQHGSGELKIASFSDTPLIQTAYQSASRFINDNYNKDDFNQLAYRLKLFQTKRIARN